MLQLSHIPAFPAVMEWCFFDKLTKGGKCITCGFTLADDYPNGYLRACGNEVPVDSGFWDTVLRDGRENKVMSSRLPCVHLGTRTELRVKEKCGNGAGMLPVYKCAVFRLTSPFGQTTDPDLITTCSACTQYHKSSENAMINSGA